MASVVESIGDLVADIWVVAEQKDLSYLVMKMIQVQLAMLSS